MSKQQLPARRLGRGLSSLLSIQEPEPHPVGLQAAQQASPHTQEERPPSSLPTASITPNPLQPRQVIKPDELESLAASIRANGILQPIAVRPDPTRPGAYQIIAGERRWRAAQLAGLSEIPATIRQADDREMLELALVENIFRSDLNPLERAQAYQRYAREFGLSADQIAQKLGEDRSTVANYMRLLSLPPEVLDMVGGGALSMGQARCLLAIQAPTELIATAKQAVEQDLSVRSLEALVRQKVAARAAAAKPAVQPAAAKRPQIRVLEELFGQQLSTKVEIAESRRKGSGKIVIHYYSLDDFDRIRDRLGVSAE